MRSDSTPGRSDSVPKIGDVLNDVDTPALIVELDALEHNVAAMAAQSRDAACACGRTPKAISVRTLPGARSPRAR
jgi:D-serine deaminase-like pyridoxal phosphate-dependent protein